MSSKSKSRAKQRLWRGLTAVMAFFLALIIAVNPIVNQYRSTIDANLGTKSTKVVTGESDLNNLYTYTSDFTTTTQLLDAIEDLGERISEEGSVLLKNNGALPLNADETGKVSLLGFSSYYPVRGGDMGSSFIPNSGTDADTVDFVEALAAKGFSINPTLQNIYEALLPTYQTEIQSWGGTIMYNNITAPSIGGFFTSKEPSQAALNNANAGWKNSMDAYNVMIVTIARGAGENRAYLPGTAGVDPSQKLNQTDPLGLSDDERDLIEAAIQAKTANGGKVIVLLNNSSPMEIQELADNAGIDAILQIGLPGGYGFYGVCDILSGAANPSGHLSDTYAVTNALSPAAQNYGDNEWTNADGTVSMNSELVEAENIYIGYKYYETRYMDTVFGQGNANSGVGSTDGSSWNYDNEVTYPFGYGLSYSTFTQTLDDLTVDLDAKTITATVKVTNTGNVPGKDVVQLYVSTPYTEYDREHGVEKAGVQLLDYAKTKELAKGETQTVTIVADAQMMTSWNGMADNAIGTKGNYILDAGDYYFAIGADAHAAAKNVLTAQGHGVGGDTAQVKSWNLGDLDTVTFAHTVTGVAVENHLEDMDINYWLPGTATYLSRSDWQGTWPRAYQNLTATAEMVDVMDNDTYIISANGDPSSVVFGANNNLTIADLKGVSDLDDERWSLLMDQITLEESMIRLGFGGGTTKPVTSINSPEVIQNDGPNGIYSYPLGRYANTDKSTGDPCAVDANDPNLNYTFGTMANETVIAQSWSKELATEYGMICGNYSLWANLTIYWGCGTNIHRLPYNARNHEYYSEDAILTSQQGNAFIQGGLPYGLIIAPKHYAFNDTEINRTGVAVFMTEQQARENELRCFQTIVQNGILGVMTAYNRVGCFTSNSHSGLMIDILREEWGFKGLMSEDFIMSANYACLKEAALNGLTMMCGEGENTMEAVSGKWDYWTVDNVSKDERLLRGIKQSMAWQFYAIANSNGLDGLSSNSRVVSVRTWYDNVITGAEIVFGLLTVGAAAMYVMSARKKDN